MELEGEDWMSDFFFFYPNSNKKQRLLKRGRVARRELEMGKGKSLKHVYTYGYV
jgi:hypothetical protein